MILGHRKLPHVDLGRRDTRLRFAWLPVRLESGQRVWLERIVQTRVVIELPVRGALYTVWAPQWSSWQYFTIEQWAERRWPCQLENPT